MPVIFSEFIQNIFYEIHDWNQFRFTVRMKNNECWWPSFAT